MRWKLILTSLCLGAALLGCTPPNTGGSGGTTTTTAPLPTLTYSGNVDKLVGCFSGAGGDDSVQQVLGTDGWWDFTFQGCSLGATESVALWDPPGGHSSDGFQAPTGYQCKMSIDGTPDETPYRTNSMAPAGTPDSGGLIFLESSAAWPDTTTWRITCIDVDIAPGGGGSTTTTIVGSTTTTSTTTSTSTTTTTEAPLPGLSYTGEADKTVGCYSGAGGDDSFHQVLGTDGWFDFTYQGCGLSETVALWDPAGGPTANAFEAPTGYKCQLATAGKTTGWGTDSIDGKDLGGAVIISQSGGNWSSPTAWTITCIDVDA